MSRIPGVDPDRVDGFVKSTLEKQARKWGVPLANHLVYARRPALFRAVRGMWAGLDESGLIDPRLSALLNRRVALLNGCEF